MDNRLLGKTILVGRESGTSRLKLIMRLDGTLKEISMGKEGSVPSSVSRCLGEGKAHCMIEIRNDGKVIVKNMNDSNVTSVNGLVIESKTVDADSKVVIRLGVEDFSVTLQEILDAVSSLFPQIYDIRPLEKVWEDYEGGLRDFRLKKERFVAISSVTGILTTCGMICMFIPGLEKMRVLFLVITVILAIFFFMARLSAPKKNFEEEQRIKNQFMDNYVCPNPKCKHFLGSSPYRVLRQNSACPHCRTKWTESDPK